MKRAEEEEVEEEEAETLQKAVTKDGRGTKSRSSRQLFVVQWDASSVSSLSAVQLFFWELIASSGGIVVVDGLSIRGPPGLG